MKFTCFKIISVITLTLYSSTRAYIKYATTYAPLPQLFKGSFYSLQSIEDTLNINKYQSHPQIRRLKAVYDSYCIPKEKESTPLKIHPFIVIEGTHRIQKDFMARGLVESLEAKLVYTTPPFMVPLKNDCTRDKTLRKIFFGLCYYVTSYDVKEIVKTKPVILSGYWMDQAVFSIAKEFPHEMPPVNSSLYEFPEDLLMPDLVIYLNSGRNKENFSPQFKDVNEKMVKVYRRMRGPEIYELNAEEINYSIIKLIRRVIKTRLGVKFSHLKYL